MRRTFRIRFAVSLFDNRKSKIQNLKWVVLTTALLSAAPFAEAQQAGKVWRIGVLASGSSSANASRNEALRQGLREFGYVERQNIVLDYRYADGKLERLPELAAELVRLKVDVIVVSGTRVAVAAKQATSTIPIVIAGVGDPVRAGLIRSFIYPGGNVTGVSRRSPDFLGKRLELLKEAVPKAVRAGALFNPDNPAYEPSLKEIELGAQASGMTLQSLTVRSPDGLAAAFAAAAKGRADILFVMADALFNNHLSRIVQLAAKTRLPAIYARSEFVEAGGLMSYGVNLADLSRQAAYYVDQIFRGRKPADLSLVEPTKFELVINLKTANDIGVTIPAEMLARADRVIR